MGTPEIRPAPHLSERGERAWLSALVVAWGAQAIVTQSLLLREALVLMFGSELAWGVVLFAWLLGVAAGATVGGWTAERLPRPEAGLVAVLLTLSAVACAEFWGFRGARAWLGVDPGELMPLPKTVLAALLFVSPAGALVGMAFPLACCVGRRCRVRRADRSESATFSESDGPHSGPYLSFGHVYALESAGSLIGGALFSFWAVEHLTPIQTALICGAVTAAASAGLLANARPYTEPRPSASGSNVGRRAGRVFETCHHDDHGDDRGRVHPSQRQVSKTRPALQTALPACLGLVALVAALVAVLAGDALNRRLVERRWRNVAPGYELVAETESKYQNLAVGQLAGQFTLYCDGQVSADFPDPYTFGPLAHFWLCQHPAPRKVLVLGGGAEGLLSEILCHPVEHVDYVEMDPRQIDLIKPYLAEADRRALTDPRVSVHPVDARYYVKTQRDRFDLVIARLPEPTSALRARFYTDEFYGELRRAMTSRSVLCTTAAAAPGELSAASRGYLASIRATLQRHFPHLVIGWGNPAQVLAATKAGLLSTDPAELAARYTQRGVKSALFHPAWFEGATDWLEPAKLARRNADLDEAKDVQISTDLRPSVYVQRLDLWEAATSGGVGPGRSRGGVIMRLRSVSLLRVIGVLAAGGGIVLVVQRLRRRSRDGWATGAVTLSIGTTGFATMALSIVWLFAFQNLYGYVYQRIGWIIALFMAGLVIGCLLASWWAGRIETTENDHRVAHGFSRGGPESARNSRPPPLKRWATPQDLCRYLIGRATRRFSGGKHECRSDSRPPRLKPRATQRSVWWCLVFVDVLLAVLALAVPFVLPALQSSPGTFLLVEWCVSLMVVATGVLGGAAFPLAGRLQLTATGRTGAAAGGVVGADHAGACLGALLCGILLVPVFGTAAAAFLLAGMKLTSAAVLAVGGRFTRIV